MKRITLELDYARLELNKKSWNLYFLIATELPSDPNKIVITTMPTEGTIKIRKPADNYINFVPKGDNAEGLFVMKRKTPEDFSVKARLWVMNSRKGTRKAGEILSGISNHLKETDSVGEIIRELGGANIWIMASKLANAGIGGVGNVLQKIEDRQLGFVNMDEHFGPEFKTDPYQERSNRISTGFGELGWTWVAHY